ncbi:MAG: EAL domain-containing protein [Candidatus Nanopelagicales bacterium]
MSNPPARSTSARTDALGEIPALERVRAVAAVSRDVVYQARPDGVIEWVQPTVQFQLGWTPEDMVGTTAMSYVHPDDLPEASRLRLTVYEGIELDDIPCRFRAKDGEYRRCLVRARPVRGTDGEVTGSIIALREIGPAEAALKALATLLAANTELVRATDEPELLAAMCRTIVGTGGYDLAWFGRKEPDGSIALLASAGPAERILRRMPRWDAADEAAGVAGIAIATGVPQRSVDLHGPGLDLWADDIARFELRSVLSIPVHVHDEVYGVLSVASHDVASFGDQAEDLLLNLAADLGYGLARLAEARELVASRARESAHLERLAGILNAQLDPLVLLEAVRDETGAVVDLRYVEANAAALAYNGKTADEQLGQLFTDMHPGLVGHGLTQRYFEVVETGEPVILDDYSYANPNVGHARRRYDIRAMRCGDGITLTWRDVTDRYAEQQRIAESEQRYRVLAENASDIVWETAADGTMQWVSESITRLLGWLPEDLLGRPTVELVHPDQRERAALNSELVLQGQTVHEEFRILAADGGHRWMSLTAQRTVRDGLPLRIVSLRDIHDEVAARDRLVHVAMHDPLTGLVNRDEMRRRTQAALDTGRSLVCVLKIGVDGLARINEGLGHEAGDALLSTVAERIVDAVGDVDLVARGTGDELIVLLTGLHDGAAAGDVADRLRDAVRRPVVLSEQELLPTVSIGIATSDRSGSRDAEQLISTAGTAMRQAKQQGPDRTLFVDDALEGAASRRLAVEGLLRIAIPRGELQPWFQPVVDIASRAVVGYEALVRWFRPDGTVMQPADFLPVAERNALILDLDRSILTQSVDKLRTLPAHQHVAVNVSAASLGDPTYAPLVEQLVARAGIRPGRLVLEITETALLAGLKDVRSTVERLASLGIRWYVDDFGTGYSSIAHLRDLPVAGLKLDRSFTLGIGSGDATCIRLAQALAGLAEGLGLDTVAEGVETEEEEAYLASQGWKHGQGWLYGKAAPLPEQG